MSEDLKRFKRVLQVRRVERELVEVELNAQRSAEEEMVETIQRMQREKESAIDAFCLSGARCFSPQELWFERQNLDVIERDLEKNCHLLNLYRTEIAKTEQRLMEKHKDYRLMEQYVNTIRERVQKQRLAEEQTNLDDLTTMRYTRALQGGNR